MDDLLPVLALSLATLVDDEQDAFIDALAQHCVRRAVLLPVEVKYERRLNLRTMPVGEFVSYFRFAYPDLRRIARMVGLPKRIVTENGVVCNRVYAMAVVCGRLAFPQRDHQFARLMQRGQTCLREIFYHTLTFIYERWGGMVMGLDTDRLAPRLAEFAEAISDAGSAYDSCFGFLDGSLKKVCRPTMYQQELYNGHKRIHCLAFQGVVTPDGLFANFYGGCPGAHHDQWVLRASGIQERIQQMLDNLPDGRHYHLYADKGYQTNNTIITPFRPYELDELNEAVNVSMSSVRVSVEWMFGVLMSLWKYPGC